MIMNSYSRLEHAVYKGQVMLDETRLSRAAIPNTSRALYYIISGISPVVFVYKSDEVVTLSSHCVSCTKLVITVTHTLTHIWNLAIAVYITQTEKISWKHS